MTLILKYASKYLIIFYPIIFIFILIVFFHDITLILKQIKTSEKNEVSVLAVTVKNKILTSTTDLYILSRNNLFKMYFQNDNNLNKKNIEQLFSLVANEKKIYDQIRFINNEGQEIIRVNFKNQSSEIIPSSKLQNKKNRYYFKDTIKLKDRDVFISPLDLNIEGGKIERPRKPMIRLATPVFYNDTNKGIVILNYYGNEIINAINVLHTDISSLIKDDYLHYAYFLNSESYWFNHSDENKNWGFMYPEKKSLNFKNEFPNEWKVISKSTRGQLDTTNGIFTFETISPALEAWGASSGTAYPFGDSEKSIRGNEYNWKLVNYVPKKELNKIILFIAIKYFVILIFGFIIILLVSLILSSNKIKQKIIQKEIEDTIESLNLSNKTKNRFFSIIAHDLKGPIGAVNGLLSLIYEGWDRIPEKKKKEIINSLCNSSQHLTNLLTNLLLWSRSQMDKIEVIKSKININEIVNKNIALFSNTAAAKKIKLENKTSHDSYVQADYNLLDTVIRNLINNAIKFTNNSGEIVINSTETKELIIINIKDNGVGIRKDDLYKLFRIDISCQRKGTNNEEGTGLGLILCKEFIELNDGKLSVESEENKGSNFSIEFKK
jgi:signal transduction histidine kinase